MSALRHAVFSGFNFTLVCELSSMWFVCAGVNTVIAFGSRTIPQFNISGKVIQHYLELVVYLHILSFKYLFITIWD